MYLYKIKITRRDLANIQKSSTAKKYKKTLVRSAGNLWKHQTETGPFNMINSYALKQNDKI